MGGLLPKPVTTKEIQEHSGCISTCCCGHGTCQRLNGSVLHVTVTVRICAREDGKSQTGHYAFGVSSMQGWRPAMEARPSNPKV